jgi:asparagine synthase (glutamine-hydrolysing)
MKEKYLLRQLAKELLPDEIQVRPKRPYRAPIHPAFFEGSPPDYVHELLSPASVATAGLFNPAAVSGLVNKLERGMPVGETDDMGLAGVLSSQLLVDQFIRRFRMPAPLGDGAKVKVCLGREAAAAQ